MSHNLTPFVLGVLRNFRKYIYIDKVYTHEKLRNIPKNIFHVAQSNTIFVALSGVTDFFSITVFRF